MHLFLEKYLHNLSFCRNFAAKNLEHKFERNTILEYEKVQIVNVNNGARFETYTIAGERGSGMICLNGAAARCASVKDKVIIMAYADMTPEEAKESKPNVVFVDEINRISRVTNYEKHGQLFDKTRLDEE